MHSVQYSSSHATTGSGRSIAIEFRDLVAPFKRRKPKILTRQVARFAGEVLHRAMLHIRVGLLYCTPHGEEVHRVEA